MEANLILSAQYLLEVKIILLDLFHVEIVQYQVVIHSETVKDLLNFLVLIFSLGFLRRHTERIVELQIDFDDFQGSC